LFIFITKWVFQAAGAKVANAGPFWPGKYLKLLTSWEDIQQLMLKGKQ
jgi:hypothetical protein